MGAPSRVGCWHYDFEIFCVTCDPATHGPCDLGCEYEHEHCECPEACTVHPEEEGAL
jgi:hypothetical protein